MAVLGVVLSMPSGTNLLSVIESKRGIAYALFALMAVGGSIKQVAQAPGLKSLQAENEELRSRLDRDGQQDYRDIFERILADFSNGILGFGPSERISIYSHDGKAFVMLGRYSQSAVFSKPSRTVYPENEGCIGDAWQNGSAVVLDLPDPRINYPEYCSQQVVRWHMPRETVENLVMKSRSYAAYTVRDLSSMKPLGVIVFESTRTDVLDPNQLEKVIHNHEATLNHILKTEWTIPKPSLAMREGY